MNSTDQVSEELSGDDGDSEVGPVRRCIVSGDRFAKETMIRFVVAPDGAVTPDVANRLPGRGLWLTANRATVSLAIKKRAFDRAARRSVQTPVDLADRLERLLVSRCREALGLARRAGDAVAGFEKVREALRAGHAGLILAASDGAAGGKEKVAWLAEDLPVVSVLSAAELGAAFGRDHVIHGVVARGPLARKIEMEAARLAGFRDLAAAQPRQSKQTPDSNGPNEL